MEAQAIVIEKPETVTQAVETASVPDEQLDAILSGTQEQEEKPPVEKEPEKKEAAPAQEPEKKPEEPPKETVTLSKEEHEKLLKQVKDKEAFIQRQAAEVGERRKREQQLLSEMENLKGIIRDKSIEDPLAAHQAAALLQSHNNELQQIHMRDGIERNKAATLQVVPTFDTLVDDMAEIAKSDGINDELVQAFRSNPYAEDPGTLINLAKRAEAARAIKERDTEIAALKTRIAELEKKPGQVVKNIEKALKEGPTITSGSGQATSVKTPIEPTQLALMTDEELDKFIKEGSS